MDVDIHEVELKGRKCIETLHLALECWKTFSALCICACSYVVMQIWFICKQSIVLPMKPCTSSSSSPSTPSGLTWRTLSLMQLVSPWGTSWCMTSFNSTAASSLASMPPYASPDLAVSIKVNNGWVGLSL